MKKLKKLMYVTCASVMLSGLVACDSADKASSTTNKETAQSVQATEGNSDITESTVDETQVKSNGESKEWTEEDLYKGSILDLVRDCKAVDNSNRTWNLFNEKFTGAFTINDLISADTENWIGLDGKCEKEPDYYALQYYSDYADGILRVPFNGRDDNLLLEEGIEKNYWMIEIEGVDRINEPIGFIIDNSEAELNADLYLNIFGEPDYIILGDGRTKTMSIYDKSIYPTVDMYLNEEMASQNVYIVYEFDGFKFIIKVIESNINRDPDDETECLTLFQKSWLISDEAYNDCVNQADIKNYNEGIKVWTKEEGYLLNNK